MFREMRRKDRQLTADEAIRILRVSDYGVMSVIGDDGYPYGVPVNYAYVNGKLYFHSTSMESHKLDAIRRNNKVCFTVITKHDLIPMHYSTNYESVVLFGTARIIDEQEEKRKVMCRMMDALAPEVKDTAIMNCGEDGYVMVEITPKYITGKARKQ